jgi:hypothetical protein
MAFCHSILKPLSVQEPIKRRAESNENYSNGYGYEGQSYWQAHYRPTVLGLKFLSCFCNRAYVLVDFPDFGSTICARLAERVRKSLWQSVDLSSLKARQPGVP